MIKESIRDYIISKVPFNHSEVRDWAGKYKDILLVFDQIFSLACSPTGTLTIFSNSLFVLTQL